MSDIHNLQPEIWQSLTASETRLPHALLFAGAEGVGKRGLAEALAARLLCEAQPAAHATACGHCPSCQMFASGNHPDFRLVQPEADDAAEEGAGAGSGGNSGSNSGSEGTAAGDKKKASKQIRIGQIRELEAFFNIGSHRGGARVCLIDPAESMNAITANSLLKILEEPTPSFYFIMVSHRWHSLLPTLISRSRRVLFAAPETAPAHAWLQAHQLADKLAWLPFFGHAPLALAQAQQRGQLKPLEAVVNDLLSPQDPLAQAARWETYVKADGGLGMEALVTTLQKWQLDLGLAVQAAPARYLPHQQAALTAQSRKLSLPLLLQAQQQVARLRRLANHPLNARLFLEDLCVRAFRPLAGNDRRIT